MRGNTIRSRPSTTINICKIAAYGGLFFALISLITVNTTITTESKQGLRDLGTNNSNPVSMYTMNHEIVEPAKNEDKGPLIFQLGTNNWQRQGEFAPGSGILHKAFQDAFNNIGDGTKSYSIYPSQMQTDPTEPDAQFKVYKLSHPIPICESASTSSSYRWHSMSEEDFRNYVKKEDDLVYDYLTEIEKKEDRKFTFFLAHHTFTNPVVLINVNKRRIENGKSNVPIFVFAHGTALKMYENEMKEREKKDTEYPERFYPWIKGQRVFEGANKVSGVFVISEKEKNKFQQIFPNYPAERIVISPNGVDTTIFYKRDITMQKLLELTQEPKWSANVAAIAKDVHDQFSGDACEKSALFVGKFASWKRIDAVLKASKHLEDIPNYCTIIVGSGPDNETTKLLSLAKQLDLQRVKFVGPKGQDDLAKFYSAASVGVFPSFEEPFGLVFIECMGCGTPVIGANSGGPKDFVKSKVGTLITEPYVAGQNGSEHNYEKFVPELAETMREAITGDWKSKMSDTCQKVAKDEHSIDSQAKDLIKSVEKLVQ